jgi:hypothetical protein
MYRIWYWAIIDRETDGRFIASIPDLEDFAAYGETDKDAVAHVTVLAATARLSARASASGRSRATPTPSTSARRTLSART